MISSALDSLQLYLGEFKALMKKPKLFLLQLANLACIVATALMMWRVLALWTGSESPVVVVLSGSMEPGFHRGDILFLNTWREEELTAGDVVVFQVEGRGIPIVHRIITAHHARTASTDPNDPNSSIPKLEDGPKFDANGNLIEEDIATKKARENKERKRKERLAKMGKSVEDDSSSKGGLDGWKQMYRDFKAKATDWLNLGSRNPKMGVLTKGDNNKIDDRGLYNARQKYISRKEVVGRAVGFLPYVGMITIMLNDYPWLKYLLISMMGFFVMIGRENGGWV